MLPGRTIKESLDKALEENDTVFLVPHNRPDMDALSACIGMNAICESKNKKTYIVIDDEVESLEKVTKSVLKEVYHDFNFITSKDIEGLITDHSLLMVLDTNKEHMVPVKDYLTRFKDIFILDHHRMDENTIKARFLFVDEALSSTCEEVCILLTLYGIRVKQTYTNYLLAGIVLDTNHYTKNTGPQTFNVAARLVNSGANPTLVNNMFFEDYDRDREVQKIVDNTVFQTFTYAIASEEDGNKKKYDIEDVAKAADYLLKYQVNASFAMAYIDEETIAISARSKGIIDVSKIMRLFGGGGHEVSAAAQVKGMSISEIKERLITLLNPTSNLEDKKEEEMKLTLNKK